MVKSSLENLYVRKDNLTLKTIDHFASRPYNMPIIAGNKT
jgi:hypothetical protein